MAGRTVDLAFKADLSQLVTQLKKMPGTTEAEAKKMAASLERQIKKAEKASVKAAKASAAAYRRQKTAMGDMGDAAAKSAQQLKGLEEVGGETSSIMGGVASALDLVSPSAGSAARALGDMSGGIEMVARSGLALAGPLAALAAGAAIGAQIWSHYAEKQKKVQAELEETRRKKLELSAAMNDLDQDLLEKKLERMREEGTITRAEHEEWKTRNRTELKFGKELDEAQQKASTARAQLIRMKEREARLEAQASPLIKGTVKALKEHRAAVAKQAEVEAQAAAEYVNLRGKIEAHNSAMVEEQNRILASHAARKVSSGSAKKRETELERLTKLTQNILPKKDLSKFEELNQHLKILEAAAGTSTKAAEALAPAIFATAEAIKALEAEKAAEELKSFIDEANRLAPPETISRLDQLIAAEARLKDEIKKTGDESGELAELRSRVHDDILEEIEEQSQATKKSADDKKEAEKKAAKEIRDAYLSAYGNINQAASMVAAEVLARAEQSAADELELREEQIDETESLLEEEIARRDELRERASSEDVARELAASDARIASLRDRATAENDAADKSRRLHNNAIRRAFTAQQAMRISEITMATAAAIMNASVTVPPALWPVVHGAIAALGATQIALVGAQEPPSFHLGGVVGSRPDERTITARAGEGVLTRQGLSAIGGEAGLTAANRGQAAQPMVIQMVYKHKVLDEVLTDSIRRGGPIGSAINRRSPRGRRNPHGRRAS